jgi:hypothetical protein
MFMCFLSVKEGCSERKSALSACNVATVELACALSDSDGVFHMKAGVFLRLLRDVVYMKVCLVNRRLEVAGFF